MIPATTVINAIVNLLTEAYDGPPDPSATWFIDNEPNSGILGLLEGVTAAEASRSVGGSTEPGSTIAGNAEHLRWSLAQINAVMRGEPWTAKWAESWRLYDGAETEWDLLRRTLREEYETLRETIKRQEDLPGEYLIGAIAMLPHAAYHLGTIRQLISWVRA